MTIFDKVWSERLYKIQFYTYLVGIYTLISLSIILAIIKIFKWQNTTKLQYYFKNLNLVIGMYCSLYLLWRYNTVADWLGLKTTPVEFTRLDRMIALHAGIVLFGLVVMVQIQNHFNVTNGVSL